ncbi:MAG: DUF3099 domain-containing protein [Pseudonocardiales bacterium]|nr:DUF3099 domain-containing protein [Pseudonocardiales bacterium]
MKPGREGTQEQHEHGRRRSDAAVLITAAEPSYAEQYATRRRKYAILMCARIPCLLLAGVFYQTWWLALTFVLLSVPLPWMAVLIANDRGPRKAEHVNRFGHGVEGSDRRQRELESGDHPVIDG